MIGASTWIATVVAFGGGALAIATGPRLVAAVGALLSAIGMFVLVGGSGAGFYLVAIGGSLFRTAMWATLAEIVLRDREAPGVAPPANRFATVTGIATLFYGAVNFSAMTSSIAVGGAADHGGLDRAFALCGVADVLATLLAGGALLAGGFESTKAATPTDAGPYRSMTAAATPGVTTAIQQGFIGLVIAIAVLCISGAGESVELPYEKLGLRADLVFAINPATIVVCSFFACAVWVAASVDRWSLSPLTIAGAGVAIVGLGVVLTGVGSSLPSLGFAAFLGGVGEILSTPALYAFIALALPRKYATLAIAISGLGVLITSAIVRPIMAIEPARTPFAIVIALASLGAGIGLAVFAKKIHRAYFDPQPV
jgi:hypothetical protein